MNSGGSQTPLRVLQNAGTPACQNVKAPCMCLAGSTPPALGGGLCIVSFRAAPPAGARCAEGGTQRAAEQGQGGCQGAGRRPRDAAAGRGAAGQGARQGVEHLLSGAWCVAPLASTAAVVGNLSLRGCLCRLLGLPWSAQESPAGLIGSSDRRLVPAQDHRRGSGAARWSGNSDSFSLYSDILAAPKPVRPWRSNCFDVPPPGHIHARCQLSPWISDCHRRPPPLGQSIQLLLICRVRMTAPALVRPAALACAYFGFSVRHGQPHPLRVPTSRDGGGLNHATMAYMSKLARSNANWMRCRARSRRRLRRRIGCSGATASAVAPAMSQVPASMHCHSCRSNTDCGHGHWSRGHGHWCIVTAPGVWRTHM